MEERIDRLVNLDIGGRGVERLYEAARSTLRKPLAMAAAERLADLKEGDVVLFTTGSISRAWVTPRIGENDGPAGTAALARALHRAFGIIPVVVVEETLSQSIGAVIQAAGFSLVSLEEARRALSPGGKTAAAVMLPFPVTDEEADQASAPLLDELRPKVAVSVERAGRNSAGVYHNMRGVDFGTGRARTDLLFEAAQARGIPVVAVGDGGNEIGMGSVEQAVRDHVPYGDRCQCPCGQGIAARTRADVLVTAAVSNWGCYAVAACLAILLKNPKLIHTPEAERVLLTAGVYAGLMNTGEGTVDPGVDGLPEQTHLAVAELLRTMALAEVKRVKGEG